MSLYQYAKEGEDGGGGGVVFAGGWKMKIFSTVF